jgi:hypothetical protein
MNYEGQCCSIHEPCGNFAKGCLIFVLFVGKRGLRSSGGKKADLREKNKRKETLSARVK